LEVSVKPGKRIKIPAFRFPAYDRIGQAGNFQPILKT